MSAILLFVVSIAASTCARSLTNDAQKKDVIPNKWFPTDLISGPDYPFKPTGPFGPLVVSRRDVISNSYKSDPPVSGSFWEGPKEPGGIVGPSKPTGPFGPIVVSRQFVIDDIYKSDPFISGSYWEGPKSPEDIIGPSKPIGSWGPIIYSRGVDFDEEDVSVEGLIELMTDVLEEVKDDMSAEDLGDAAASVEYLADSLLVINGAQVNQQDVMQLILEIASEFGSGDVDLSVLFDDPLKFEARALTYALRLWRGLTDRLVQQNAEGSSVDTTLAAISFTAEIIQNALRNTVRLMTDMVKGGHLPLGMRQKPLQQTKRQNVDTNLSLSASKTFKFDSSSLTFSGKVSTSDFQTVKVDVGVSFNF